MVSGPHVLVVANKGATGSPMLTVIEVVAVSPSASWIVTSKSIVAY